MITQKKNRLNAKTVGARLRKIRDYFGYTQEQMAALTGILKSTYEKNERGNHLIQTDNLATIHEQMGVSAEWLLFGRAPVFWNEDKKRKDMEFKDENREDAPVSGELAEMIEVVKGVPFLRHAVLGHFQKLKLENQHLLKDNR